MVLFDTRKIIGTAHQSHEQKVKLKEAQERLQRLGCCVHLACGSVYWPTYEAAAASRLTEQMIVDSDAIYESVRSR